MSKKFKIIFGLMALVLIWVSSNLNWGKKNWQYFIEADAKGYYSYLPAAFIYKDLNFGFFDSMEREKYYNVHTFYDYRIGWKNHVINKYYIGVALAQVPFFFLSHGLTMITGNAPDGFSYWYPVGVNLAAICYGLAGLYCLYRWLRLKNVSDGVSLLAVVICALGTHLFYYIIGEGGMSHVYSFFFINCWLLITTRLVNELKVKWLMVSAFLLGMIVVIRPVNGLVLFSFPLLFDKPNLMYGFFSLAFQKLKKAFIFALIIFVVPIFIQLGYYKLATGDWLVYSYGEEGFHFLEPHVWDILFSYKKGLFLYTPICLMGVLLGVFAQGQMKFHRIYYLFFFFMITYVFSSWWMWYYGGSFSSRVYVEFLFLFIWPIADFLENVGNRVYRKAVQIVAMLLIVLCQIQTYQYRYFQIHWVDMNKEKYWEVFLRIDKCK